MAYEEASVAGETPDRSKQRKSSGNPTPEETSGPAPEERDPRLAITRETPQVREEVPEDRATAVFSTKDVAEAADGSDGSDGPDEADSGAEDAPEADAPKGEANGDARLRNAVAAWVATSDEDAEPTAASDDSDPKSDTTVEPEESDRTEESDRGETFGAADAGPAASAKREPEPEPSQEAKPEPTSEAKPEPKAAPEAGAGAKPEAKAGAAPEAEPKAEGEPEPKAEGEPEPKAEGEPKPKTEGKPVAGPGAKIGAKAESGAGPEPVSWPDAASKADAEPESDPAPELDAAAEDDPAEADAADAKSTGVDQATAVFKAPKVPEAKGKAVDQPTTMLKLGEGAKGTAKKETAKPEADAERTSKFVALKPLDEPKAKPAPKAGPVPAPKAVPGAEPKSPAPKSPQAAQAKASPTAPAGPAVPPPVERTTQQPLPPKPPIDLLAELTNTPPPPETPVRTAVRRVKIWTPLVLLLLVVFAVVQVVRPLPTPTLQLTAQETSKFEGGKPDVPWPADGQAAMDVNGIGTFGTSGEQKPVPIASIAKVMTVYLILRDHPLKKGDDGPKIPVDAAAQKHYETGKPANESVVKVTEGQKITEYEALQAVMLPSANNIAKLLARWDTKSGSEDAFVEKMNKTAKELGMKNTHYTDPSGLDKTTVSTAEDLVKLGRAAMENPVFNEISRQPSYTDLNNEKQTNFFKLVPTVAIGIKTGTTTAAGGNILFAAEKKVGGETQTIIGAALGQYGSNGVANIDKVTDVTKNLIAAGQDALKAKTIVKKGDVVGQVDDGLGGTTPVVATKDVSAVGWSGLTVKLELDDIKGKTIPNTAKAGTEVGVLHVGDGKGDAVEVPVALQKDLAEPGFGAKLTRIG
ncbi:D-alanyl-D-alanine carboxypeptidase [Streptomyces venezuelae]|uniref:D-alanyl-D-alanine carboxypeptidase n=1 Tax=Streptomyces venezuelae TaxID=54571 RepID=UPI00342ACA6F